MVSKGQFLERPTLIPSGQLVLEGLWHRGGRRPPLLIVPPLPSEGGSMDHVIAAEIAWAAAKAGFPSLRFNFRGVGASQGERSNLDASLQDDVAAASALLSENVGQSLSARLFIGGSARLASGDAERVRSICLVSPRELEPAWLKQIAAPLLVVTGAEERRPTDSFPLSEAVAAGGGRWVEVPGADAAFLRNLPEVGKTVAGWLESLE